MMISAMRCLWLAALWFRIPKIATLVLTVGLSLSCTRQPDLVWTAINVNPPSAQGDAHLLQINRNVNILIDTGHYGTAAELPRFLKERGGTRLQAVIITHGHSDHYGGLAYLLDHGIAVDCVYFNPPAPELVAQEPWGCTPEEIAALLATCRRHAVPVQPLTNRSEWRFDHGITLKVLYVYDGLQTPVGRTDINDTSAILLLTHGRMRYLLTGDLNRRLGDYITGNTAAVPLQAHVLKVPHHGAEGLPNDAFFTAVNPQLLVVPAPAALWQSERCARLRALAERIPARVNGLHGHITIKSYGDRFEVESEHSLIPGRQGAP